MAMGLPVIISDFPAWREMLDGVQCALWVDPEDPNAIARAMKTLLDDPDLRRRMGADARRAIVEKYNWDTQLENLTVLYSSLLG